ncbi:cytochrome b-c1 complex subunit 6, mitochondrial-like [Ostrinia nubilalis]|uniref:cytochrome b-c1 complex subunit 6, mitochondrial-like n=1 Tax=Ostrinia nubilalis TaxID=29057 RepID=UPI0030825BA9
MKSILFFLPLVTFFVVFDCVVASSILGTMSDKLIPVVKAEEAEEEMVDPQTQLREECSQKADAQNMWGKYQECNDRVNSRSKTTETCEEELIDYLHVLDKCVTKDLFNRLK